MYKVNMSKNNNIKKDYNTTIRKRKNNPHSTNIFGEISELKTAFKVLSVDINWIKKELNELKNRIWWIITLIVGTLLTVILTKLI